jgi:hypothetical protein
VKDLASDRKMSVAQVGYQAYDPDTRGTNPDTFKSVMVRRRAVTPVLIEVVARVLGVPPETFGEYRLALARRELDEREVGLDQALENLDRIQRAMRARPRRAAGHASAPEEANPAPPQADRRAGRNRKAG